MTDEAILSRIKPDEVKHNKKSRKIDLEVMDLKAKLYSADPNVTTIILSNREIRLLRFFSVDYKHSVTHHRLLIITGISI